MMPDSEDQREMVDRPNLPPSPSQPGIDSNPMLRCPLPNIVAPSADNLRQFYGSQVGQYRLLQPLLPSTSSTTTVVNTTAAQAATKSSSATTVAGGAHGPNRAVQVAQAAPNGGFTFDGDAGFIYDQFPDTLSAGEPVAFAVNNITVSNGTALENYCGSVPNFPAGMLEYVAADNTIIYACRDNHIRKFSCNRLAIIQDAVIPGAVFGNGGITHASNVSQGLFALAELNSPSANVIEIWDAVRLVKIGSYGAATFGGVAPNPATQRTIAFDASLTSVWLVEGSGTLVRYNYGTGVRTVIGGVTVASPGIVNKSPVANLVVCAFGSTLTTISTDTNTVVTTATMPLNEVDPDGSTPCGAVWDGSMAIDPDGYIWICCNGEAAGTLGFAGHTWKIDPATLIKVARTGKHQVSSLSSIVAGAVPIRFSATPVFADALAQKFAFQIGDGAWVDLALWDRSTITHDPSHGPLLTVLFNPSTTPALVPFGTATGGIFTGENGNYGVVAGGGSLWAFLNVTGTSTDLLITQVTLTAGPTFSERVLVSENGDVTGSYVLIGRDGKIDATGTLRVRDVAEVNDLQIDNAKAAHTALMGPTSGSAAPTFRTLVASDLPALGSGVVAHTTANATGTVPTPTVAFTVEEDTTGSSVITRTLPAAAAWPNAYLYFKKVDSGAGSVKIVPASGTIEGLTEVDLTTQYAFAVLFSDGTAIYNLSSSSGGTVTHTAATLTAHRVVLGNGGDDVETPVVLGTAGQYLRSSGAGADPAYATPTPSEVGLGSVTNDAQLKASQLDTDGTLSANSDLRVASQKATKTYADTKAPLVSPTFTGTPTAPTPAGGDNSTKIATTAFVATSAGSGALAPARTSVLKTTGSLASGNTERGSVAVAKSALIVEVTADRAAWVRLYSSAAARDATAEVNRSLGVDPALGTQHGVILDLYVNATVGLTYVLAPTVVGSDMDAGGTNLYYAIQNLSGATSTVAVTIYFVPMEN